MKILFITYDFANQSGGIAGYTAKLTDYLLAQGEEVHLLTKHCDYKPLNLIVHNTFVKKFLEPMPLLAISRRNPLRIFPWLQQNILDAYDSTRLVRQKEGEFEIIHSSSTCSWKCDVVTVHNCQKAWTKINEKLLKNNYPYLKYLFYKTGRWLPDRIILNIEKEVLEKGNKKIIAFSKSTKREILENYNVPEEKIVVIPPGINLNEFEQNVKVKSKIRKELGINQNACVLMFSGGLDLERKGLKYLIQALPLVKDEIKLLITGAGNLRPYKQLANSLNVLDKIVFTGFVSKINDYYAASDIFVFPTTYEPFGITTLEAMATGLPVIVSKLAGSAEIIKNGYEGLLLDNPMDFKEIAEKVNHLVNNKNLRKQMGENAYKTAQKYPWKEIARRTLEVYKEVLKMKRQ